MGRVDLVHARTTARDPGAAADELIAQLGGVVPKLLMVYASSDRYQPALNRALRERLPAGTRLLGATTGGEIDRDGMHQGSVIVAALTGDFDIGIGLGKGLSKDAARAGELAIQAAAQQIGA